MSQFIITYKGDATKDGFDMAIIGESMMGFNSLLKDFYKVCGIDGELQVKTSEVRLGNYRWSIDCRNNNSTHCESGSFS